jgi:hypothetical protein
VPFLEAAASLLDIEEAALERALTVKSVGKFPVVQVSQGKEWARQAWGRVEWGEELQVASRDSVAGG